MEILKPTSANSANWHWKPLKAMMVGKELLLFGVERPIFFKGEVLNFREGILLQEELWHIERMTFSPMLPMSYMFFSFSFDKAAQPSEWVEVVFPPPRLFPGCGCPRLTEIPTNRVPGNNSYPGSCRYFCTTYVLLVPWQFGSRGVKERKKNRSILNKNFRNMMGELLY